MPKTLHKVIQEYIPLHKAKPLKNDMFIRSPGQKQPRNFVLQLAITCYNPEFPPLHQKPALPDMEQNCAQEQDLKRSSLGVPGAAH